MLCSSNALMLYEDEARHWAMITPTVYDIMRSPKLPPHPGKLAVYLIAAPYITAFPPHRRRCPLYISNRLE